MLVKLERYALLVVSFIAAILAILYARRGEKLSDVRAEIARSKLDAKINNLTKEAKDAEDNYRVRLNKYLELRNRYGTKLGKGGDL